MPAPITNKITIGDLIDKLNSHTSLANEKPYFYLTKGQKTTKVDISGRETLNDIQNMLDKVICQL